jgi:hypothetical protein
MVRTQIYLPKSYIDKLKEKATQDGTTLSDVIRKIISKEILTEAEKGKKYANSGEWLMTIAEESKKYTPEGPTDLSSNVDKYLYGDE